MNTLQNSTAMIQLRLSCFLLFLSLGLSSQCLDDEAHNTSLVDMWLSCDPTPNPLRDLGTGHWILYEFEEVQPIESIQIWNLNHPDALDSGIKSMRIDYSADAATWSELGAAELPQAAASSDYVGIDLDLESFEARFVLFTATDNYGGPCAGLSEVKFNLSQMTTATEETYLSSQISILPNPADQWINVSFGDIQSQQIAYQLVDAAGRVVLRDQTSFNTIRDGFQLEAASLSEGHYTLQLQTDEGVASKQIIIIHTQ